MLIFIITMLFVACSSAREINNPHINNGITSQVKIKKIKKHENDYIIYATRNDSIFKIVSNVNNMNASDMAKIKVGKSYNLDLKRFYPNDSLKGKHLDFNYEMARVFDIGIEKKCHYSLYYAKNLKGLYIE